MLQSSGFPFMLATGVRNHTSFPAQLLKRANITTCLAVIKRQQADISRLAVFVSSRPSSLPNLQRLIKSGGALGIAKVSQMESEWWRF